MLSATRSRETFASTLSNQVRAEETGKIPPVGPSLVAAGSGISAVRRGASLDSQYPSAPPGPIASTSTTASRTLQPSTAKSWGTEQVSNWLDVLDLGQYTTIFKENAISGDVLLELDTSDLDYMKISALGHRKTILRGVDQLRVACGLLPQSAAQSIAQAPVQAATSTQTSTQIGSEADPSGSGNGSNRVHWSHLAPLSSQDPSGGGAPSPANTEGNKGKKSIFDGEYNEEAERSAFQAAVMAWRRGKGVDGLAAVATGTYQSPNSKKIAASSSFGVTTGSKTQGSQAQAQKDVSTTPKASVVADTYTSNARESATASDEMWTNPFFMAPATPEIKEDALESMQDGAQDDAGKSGWDLFSGELDEEAERKAFQEAVAAWRKAGSSANSSPAKVVSNSVQSRPTTAASDGSKSERNDRMSCYKCFRIFYSDTGFTPPPFNRGEYSYLQDEDLPASILNIYSSFFARTFCSQRCFELGKKQVELQGERLVEVRKQRLLLEKEEEELRSKRTTSQRDIPTPPDSPPQEARQSDSFPQGSASTAPTGGMFDSKGTKDWASKPTNTAPVVASLPTRTVSRLIIEEIPSEEGDALDGAGAALPADGNLSTHINGIETIRTVPIVLEAGDAALYELIQDAESVGLGDKISSNKGFTGPIVMSPSEAGEESHFGLPHTGTNDVFSTEPTTKSVKKLDMMVDIASSQANKDLEEPSPMDIFQDLLSEAETAGQLVARLHSSPNNLEIATPSLS